MEAKCPPSVPGHTWVCDANHQELAEDICHHLHGSLAHDMGMPADQVDGWREEARARAGGLHPDFLVLAIEEVVRAVPDKLSQRMP